MTSLPPRLTLVQRMSILLAARMAPLVTRRLDAGLATTSPHVLKSVLFTLFDHGDSEGFSSVPVETIAAESEITLDVAAFVLDLLVEERILGIFATAHGRIWALSFERLRELGGTP